MVQLPVTPNSLCLWTQWDFKLCKYIQINTAQDKKNKTTENGYVRW